MLLSVCLSRVPGCETIPRVGGGVKCIHTVSDVQSVAKQRCPKPGLITNQSSGRPMFVCFQHVPLQKMLNTVLVLDEKDTQGHRH